MFETGKSDGEGTLSASKEGDIVNSTQEASEEKPWPIKSEQDVPCSLAAQHVDAIARARARMHSLAEGTTTSASNETPDSIGLNTEKDKAQEQAMRSSDPSNESSEHREQDE